MRPSGNSQTGVGAAAWVPLDPYTAADNVGLYVKATGTVTYSVEVTPDNIFDSAITPQAYPCDVAALTAATTTQSGVMTKPARAARVNVTAGTGVAALTVVVSSTL
jgi:hypothetical protein